MWERATRNFKLRLKFHLYMDIESEWYDNFHSCEGKVEGTHIQSRGHKGANGHRVDFTVVKTTL